MPDMRLHSWAKRHSCTPALLKLHERWTMFFKLKMSKIFVVKIPKIFDKIFFQSREKNGGWKQEKWSWNAKNMTLFFKNIGFELRFLWFCVAKPIILESKTYGFGE